jgi:enoyl-CoA hydratase/carnithine racemase
MAEIIAEGLGPVELWTLDVPGRRNALSVAVVDRLAEEIARVSQDRSVRVVVLTGAGGQAFSAGADLKERATMSEEAISAYVVQLRRAFRALELSDRVFLAHLNGAALGGGAELALACDVRTMASTATFGLTEVTLGIIPGAGGTQRLTRLVGVGVAKELILSGRRLDAEEAVAKGVASRIATLEEALALARGIAANAPIALGAAKHAIDLGVGLDLDAALTLERQAYQRTMGTEDRREGLLAFAEKRVPVYRGR